MRLEMLAKDTGSGDTGCPSVYIDEAGGLVVQGESVDAATVANLVNLLPGEAAVRITPTVVAAAMRRYADRGAAV